MNIRDHREAYKAFENRKEFVNQLANMMEIKRNENGALIFPNETLENKFYDELEDFDKQEKEIANAREWDKYDAEQDAQQGVQSLTDDE